MATVNGSRTQVLTSNTDTDVVDCIGPALVAAVGTFDSGTITFYTLTGSGVEIALADTALTAAGLFLVDFPPRSKNKVFGRLAGATSPSLTVWINSGS